ncbi:hypothetical protein ACKRZS_007019 [Fusarium odoratissimum]
MAMPAPTVEAISAPRDNKTTVAKAPKPTSNKDPPSKAKISADAVDVPERRKLGKSQETEDTTGAQAVYLSTKKKVDGAVNVSKPTSVVEPGTKQNGHGPTSSKEPISPPRKEKGKYRTTLAPEGESKPVKAGGSSKMAFPPVPQHTLSATGDPGPQIHEPKTKALQEGTASIKSKSTSTTKEGHRELKAAEPSMESSRKKSSKAKPVAMTMEMPAFVKTVEQSGRRSSQTTLVSSYTRSWYNHDLFSFDGAMTLSKLSDYKPRARTVNIYAERAPELPQETLLQETQPLDKSETLSGLKIKKDLKKEDPIIALFSLDAKDKKPFKLPLGSALGIKAILEAESCSAKKPKPSSTEDPAKAKSNKASSTRPMAETLSEWTKETHKVAIKDKTGQSGRSSKDKLSKDMKHGGKVSRSWPGTKTGSTEIRSNGNSSHGGHQSSTTVAHQDHHHHKQPKKKLDGHKDGKPQKKPDKKPGNKTNTDHPRGHEHDAQGSQGHSSPGEHEQPSQQPSEHEQPVEHPGDSPNDNSPTESAQSPAQPVNNNAAPIVLLKVTVRRLTCNTQSPTHLNPSHQLKTEAGIIGAAALTSYLAATDASSPSDISDAENAHFNGSREDSAGHWDDEFDGLSSDHQQPDYDNSDIEGVYSAASLTNSDDEEASGYVAEDYNVSQPDSWSHHDEVHRNLFSRFDVQNDLHEHQLQSYENSDNELSHEAMEGNSYKQSSGDREDDKENVQPHDSNGQEESFDNGVESGLEDGHSVNADFLEPSDNNQQDNFALDSYSDVSSHHSAEVEVLSQDEDQDQDQDNNSSDYGLYNESENGESDQESSPDSEQDMQGDTEDDLDAESSQEDSGHETESKAAQNLD